MANIEHSTIADPNIHEPKGVSSATSGQVYLANGLGGGAWGSIGGLDTAVYVETESDFPNQDATTITLLADTAYVITGSFSTNKNFLPQQGSSITGRNIDAHTLTYTGITTMFSGTDVDFFIINIALDCPNAQAFSFTDTVGGVSRFICLTVQVNNTTKFGTFSDLLLVEIINCNSPNPTQGISFSGTSGTILSLDKFALFSTNTSFIGLDFGSAVINIIELSNLFFTGPAGAIAMSGLVDSGNVPTGSLAMLSNSEFLGGMTPLQNITVDDIRWVFSLNNPIRDTFADAMLSLNSNATETVITSSSTPVKVAGTWVVERESLLTSDTTGKTVYDAERDIVLPVDVSVSIDVASGTNKDIKVYLALNGTKITNSGKSSKISSGSPQSISVLWQLTLTATDFLEVFVENNTDTVNIIVIDAILRVR